MYQDAFVPAKGIYLLNHSVGRMPHSTREHTEKHFFEAWERGQPDAWSLWLEGLAEFKNALAELFNGEASHFCPQTNISSVVTKTLYALPPKPGKNVILISENDFPSVGFAIQQAERQGYRIRFLPAEADVQQLDTWDDALTDDVHTVLITHVHFNTSKLIPVGAITQLCRLRDITSIVDIAQSSGIVPIDLQQWQADIVVGSCVKWLCGGPGAGFIWVDPQVVTTLEPLDVGWFSHQNPMEFDIHHFQYADDTSRFWGGTPSVLPYVVASNSINLIHKIGVKTIRAHNQTLTQALIDSIDPGCVVTPTDAKARGGTLVLKFPNQDQVQEALNEAGVLFDVRPLGLRLSPHIYNTHAEIETVISCLPH